MAEQRPLESVIQIGSKPGIKRDGTQLDGDFYVDGEWVRFQNGRPRKIGGYRSVDKYLRGLAREVSAYTQSARTYLHLGSASYVERLYLDGATASVIADRTPTSGFTADDRNLWQFTIAARLNAGAWTNKIIAQVAPNLECICSPEPGAIFAGDLTADTPLTSVALPAGANATGGVVAVHPYLFYFGTDGIVGWSIAGDPTDLTGTGSGHLSVASQKIVRGMQLRGGGGNSPAALFWSADALVRATFVGGAPVWAFDTISDQSSILSSRSVIEYDGVYYWAGSDRFLMFNGVVREVPNPLNANFFFDELNYAHRQKVFVTKVPRFGEIWWCYPRGTSTEPNHAVIYNVRENTWYDTPLPEGGRSASTFPTVYRKPLMTGVEAQPYTAIDATVAAGGTGYVAGDTLTLAGGDYATQARVTVTGVDGSGAVTGASIVVAGSYTTTPANPAATTGGSGTGATFTMTYSQLYKLWIHEQGVNAIDGAQERPIRSFFETGNISMPITQGVNRRTVVLMVEPDFVQTGDMSLTVTGQSNSRASSVSETPVTFNDTAESAEAQVLHLTAQRRMLRFRFESNVVGGDYQAGLSLAHVRTGDGTTVG